MNWPIILYAIVGGIVAELITIHKLESKHFNDWPVKYKYPSFWIIKFFMILTGGFLAQVYIASGTTLTPILAVNIGMTAPMILGNMAGRQPQIRTRNRNS